MKTTIARIECPECGQRAEPDRDPEAGDLLTCPTCGHKWEHAGKNYYVPPKFPNQAPPQPPATARRTRSHRSERLMEHGENVKGWCGGLYFLAGVGIFAAVLCAANGAVYAALVAASAAGGFIFWGMMLNIVAQLIFIRAELADRD